MGDQKAISVARFIDRLDAAFNRNDMKSAQECIRFWEAEARRLNDERGLLTVLNEAVGYYRRAKKKTESYEYAALLNNRAATLYELKRYDEAEADYLAAIRILKNVGFHDGEIAVSLLMLTHLTYDRDGSSYEKVEALLDEAWDYINSDNQPKGGNYAYILRKCAPSLDYFKRPEEAQACREVAKEIYSDHRE